MELNGYRLLLPEGTLDYFDLVDVKESVNEVVFYLEEKNMVPEKYTDQDTESKGFYDPVIVQDFPLRGKKVFLNIRRRRWLLKKHNEYISRNWRMVAEGTRMTQDFASFLKELYRYKHRYSFRIVANPLHDQVGPNGDNHLDGYGIDAPINPRQLQIKHLRACN